MVKSPEFDNASRGGADIWDSGLAGEILFADYIPAVSAVAGIKVWMGSWVTKPVKVWMGSWVTKPVKRWSGSVWV